MGQIPILFRRASEYGVCVILTLEFLVARQNKKTRKKRAKKWVEGKYIRMMIQLNNKVTGNRAALYILGMLNTEETKDDVDQKKKKERRAAGMQVAHH
jgi:hypothetical protein